MVFFVFLYLTALSAVIFFSQHYEEMATNTTSHRIATVLDAVNDSTSRALQEERPCPSVLEENIQILIFEAQHDILNNLLVVATNVITENDPERFRSLRLLILAVLRKIESRLQVTTHRGLQELNQRLNEIRITIDSRISELTQEEGALREADDFLQQMQVAIDDAQMIHSNVDALKQVMQNRQSLLTKLRLVKNFPQRVENITKK